MIADKACAERGCACLDSRVDEPGVQMYTKDEYETHYNSGWNAALEMAAFRIQHNLKRAFPENTLASFAVYIKEMKK
jgi:hypothetical protein